MVSKHILLGGLCCTLCLNLWGQMDNSALFFNEKPDTSRSRELYANVQNLCYMKNNEYSGIMADGSTFFGYQFNPQLGYKFNKHLSMTGGIFLLKDFGNPDFRQVLPTFTIRYVKRNYSFLFGNIDGSLNHQLIEPLYNFERVITNRLENGAQFKLDKKWLSVDLWIDWLSMAYRYSNNQERLFGGASLELLKVKNKKWEFSLPLQATAFHEGGQLDTLHLPISTNSGFSGGLKLKYHCAGGFIKSIYSDVRYAGHRRRSQQAGLVWQDYGDGILANIGIKARWHTDLMLSYWYGDNFYNDFSGHLYSSRSTTVAYPNYYMLYRQLFILRFTKVFSVSETIKLVLRAEPHYDVTLGYYEMSYGLYIKIDERFWLKDKKAELTRD